MSDSWDRNPEMKVRIRENSLKDLVRGLDTDGFCSIGTPKARLLDGEILIEMVANVGKHPDIIAFPIDILIPIPEKLRPKVDNNDPEEEKEEPKESAGPATKLSIIEHSELDSTTAEQIVIARNDSGSGGLSGGSGESVCDRPNGGDGTDESGGGRFSEEVGDIEVGPCY